MTESPQCEGIGRRWRCCLNRWDHALSKNFISFVFSALTSPGQRGAGGHGATCWSVMRRDYLDYAADAVGFARVELQFDPDAKQIEILQSRRKRIVLNWGRQGGKSTVVVAKAVHYAVMHAGVTIVILGGEERHTAGFLVKVDQFLARLGWPVRGVPGLRLSRSLPNGSRFVTMTTNTGVRGETAAMVIVDEAAYVSDAVWESMLPVLATTDGIIIVLSTPNGRKGWFYELWRNGPGWFRSEYRADHNPRISPQFLKEVAAMQGERFLKQEFLCEFLDDGESALRDDDVDGLYR